MALSTTGTATQGGQREGHPSSLEQEFDHRVRAIELEVASRRSQEKVVTYLGYAAIAAGILIGAFGISEISDIDETVAAKIEEKTSEVDNKLANVDLRIGTAERVLQESFDNAAKTLDLNIDTRIASYLDTNRERLQEFKALGADIDAFLTSLREAEDKWESTVKPRLAGLEGVDPDEDLKGRYLEVFEESNLPPVLRPSDWRLRTTAVIKRITAQLSEAANNPDATTQFDPNELFNVAQLARKLDRFDLERNLTNAAYNADSGTAARALFLQSEAQYRQGEHREAAFNDLLDMVRHLTLESPQIVVAEAWNAAEALRRYGDLIDAIDDLIRKQAADPLVFLPSHVLAIKGNAHQRRGLPSDLEQAVNAYALAVDKLSEEGLLSQWAEATISDTTQYLRTLRESGADISALDLAVERSAVQPLRIQYEESTLPGPGSLHPVDGDENAGEPSPEMLMEILRALSEQEAH